MTFPIPVSCRVSYPNSSLVFLLSMRCGIDPASPSCFYILLDDTAGLSMFYPAFAPLSTTGMVILPAPLSSPAARARSPKRGSNTTLFRARRLTSLMHPAASLISTRRETQFRTAAESSDLSTKGFVEFLWIALEEIYQS
ncbi:hypothetical protein G4B88_002368 (mitochondrion) [Cannabis sativa]|uniref:Uncharacterized protein n=1 Tax=Cannabis sativa TaxID=3483 RepID=A0A7J6DV99_CANSA|nr:hypothetical protein G4B88_002368 [Cannabis sativa]